MRTNIKHLTLNLLPSIEEIKEIKKERKVAIYGDLKWEDIRMDPQYYEYWKVVNYYVERCERIIIMNGFISHGEPSMVGSILWSDGSYDKFLQEELC
jgi:hypothetical protein